MKKEKQKEYNAAYYQANKEKICAASAAWRKANPEKVRVMRTAYWKNNPEKARAQSVAWRKVNPEKARAVVASWRKAHPEEASTCSANRRARKRNAEGRHTAEEIKKLLSRQKCRCAVCRKSIEDGYHKDHIVSLSKGGSNYIRNIQLLCPKCNLKKKDKHPIKFMQEQGFLL